MLHALRTPWVALALGFALALSGVATAQTAAAYDPLVAFAPLSLPGAVNSYRSANGAPGPTYWQNRADYSIAAKIEPANKTLTGDVTITYTNNSPDTLDVLWLQLDQNIYRKDSRAAAMSGGARGQFTDGYILDAVEILGANGK